MCVRSFYDCIVTQRSQNLDTGDCLHRCLRVVGRVLRVFDAEQLIEAKPEMTLLQLVRYANGSDSRCGWDTTTIMCCVSSHHRDLYVHLSRYLHPQ
jgi:hypothetical protein